MQMRLVALTSITGLLLMPAGIARGGEAKPNLVVASVATKAGQAQANDRISIEVTTKNVGAGESGKSRTEFVLSKDKRYHSSDWPMNDYQRVPALDPGERATAKVKTRLYARTPTGKYFLLACVDRLEEVKEESERDNCRAMGSRLKVEDFAPAQIEVSPPSHDFGSVAVGSRSAPVRFTLTNVGDAPADMRGSLIWPSDWELSNDECQDGSLGGQRSCTVDLTFVPTREGVLDGEMKVEAEGQSNPVEVELRGVGTRP